MDVPYRPINRAIKRSLERNCGGGGKQGRMKMNRGRQSRIFICMYCIDMYVKQININITYFLLPRSELKEKITMRTILRG